jgi:hypothetical protein
MLKLGFLACGIGVSKIFFLIDVIARNLFLSHSGWTYQDVKFNGCQVNDNLPPHEISSTEIMA